MAKHILVVNPGSTSDEIALFKDEDLVFHKVVRYTPLEMQPFDGKKVSAQLDMRTQLVLKTLEQHDTSVQKLDAIIGLGGLLHAIPSGTYRVCDRLLSDLEKGVLGDHPCNLGGIIAHRLATPHGIPALTADPVVVDELQPLARYTGMPEAPRLSIFHALNHKRVGRLAAAQLNKKYEQCNFIIMHGGGGVTVGAHLQGRVIDVNNGLDGEGPFTPQRAGTVPTGTLAALCFSGKISKEEMKLKIKGQGGLIAHTGTSDVAALEKFIQQEPLSELEKTNLKPDLTREKALEAVQAMAYQMSKFICGMAAPLKGKVDAILLTGGLAYSKNIIVPFVREHVEWIAPVLVFPGGDEMRALRDAAARVLEGEEKTKDYEKEIIK